MESKVSVSVLEIKKGDAFIDNDSRRKQRVLYVYDYDSVHAFCRVSDPVHGKKTKVKLARLDTKYGNGYSRVADKPTPD